MQFGFKPRSKSHTINLTFFNTKFKVKDFQSNYVYVRCPQVQKLYLATGNDRLKLLVLYSGEDDERLRKAAAGTLAMLTAEQPELCTRIPETVGSPQLPSLYSHLG